MKHERRVIGHASGWQEQMDTCVCGRKWPCPELLTSKDESLPELPPLPERWVLATEGHMGEDELFEIVTQMAEHINYLRESLRNARVLLGFEGSQHETSAGDRATATACEIIRTFEHALVKIDTYSPASTVQPVQIAREALTKAYGPDYRSAVKTSGKSAKCLVADCPEQTADGQAMCAEHMQRIEP